MRMNGAACREPAEKLWQLCKVLYVFEHKTQYFLSMLQLPALWYFDTSVMYAQWFRRVKFVVILPRLYKSNICEILLYNRQWVGITYELICGVWGAYR